MTAEDQGAMHGAAVARAAFAGDATAQRWARDEAVAAWPAPCRGRWWKGHDAAYRQAWARLEVPPNEASLTCTYQRAARARRETG